MAGQLTERLVPIVRDLRLGASAAALSAFAEFTGALIEALTARGDGAEDLMPTIELAAAAQGRADYVGLADVLEYELAPRLGVLFGSESASG